MENNKDKNTDQNMSQNIGKNAESSMVSWDNVMGDDFFPEPNFTNVYDVGILYSNVNGTIEVSFLTPPLPGSGYAGVLWNLAEIYPCIDVKELNDNSFTCIDIFSAPLDIGDASDEDNIEESISNFISKPIKVNKEKKLNSLTYVLYIPVNLDILEVVDYLQNYYISKGLSVFVSCDDFKNGFDSDDDDNGGVSAIKPKQPVLT